ncbi:hypothetical protein ACFQ7O_23965 [Streptomyces sp. NPDC056485]|uniref:hypothetical protein n=1 Tax=Streptomyces sp. NPDC056485 TaxID=3345834 RepID=UPI0036984187
MPVSGRRYKALQQQHELDAAELETVRAELAETLQRLDSSRKLVTTLMHSPATTAEQRLRAELRRSEEARQALDVRITVLQAANEGAYREAYELAKDARGVRA